MSRSPAHRGRPVVCPVGWPGAPLDHCGNIDLATTSDTGNTNDEQDAALSEQVPQEQLAEAKREVRRLLAPLSRQMKLYTWLGKVLYFVGLVLMASLAWILLIKMGVEK